MSNRREYVAGPIAVSFDSSLCIHTAKCLQGLPQVFDLQARPWIQPANAAVDEVIEVVNRCPSGALQWRMVEGEHEDTVAEEEAAIAVTRNGPLWLRGNFELLGGDGVRLIESNRLALCRCGLSANKPFCDNTHRRENWKA